MLPNFFVVGAQKSGTTSLHFYLSEHSDVYLPTQKETKFFVDDNRYSRGIKFYETEYFLNWKGEKAIGEVDPEYMYFDQALMRMAKHLDLGRTKFIFILRNPIERAFSHYLMTYRRGLEELTFEEAIEREEERIQISYKSKMHYSYVSRGFYYSQICRFLNYSDRDQMLFLLSEELQNDTKNCLKKCFKFLQVSDDFNLRTVNDRFNTATVPRSLRLLHYINRDSITKELVRLFIPWEKPRKKLRQKLLEINQTDKVMLRLSNNTKQKLLNLYRDENRRLESLIGYDLDYWFD